MVILNYINTVLLEVIGSAKELPVISIDWSILVPSGISILGFIITYKLTNKNLKDEIKKFKYTMMIENNKEILEDLVTFIDETQVGKFNNVKNLNAFTNKVYAFGSTDLIRIYADYRQMIYRLEKENKNSKNKSGMNSTLPLAYFTLMITQTKFDFTGEITPPSEIFRIWLRDYESNENNKKSINNDINILVDKLKLNENFKV